MTLLASRSFASFLVAVGTTALLVACSSSSDGSSSSGTGGSGAKLGGADKLATCKNTNLNHPRTAADDRCDACDATKCSSESAAGIGTDPAAFGGACADFLTCSCDCDAMDAACAQACAPKLTPACRDATAAALECEKSKCASECAKDGG